MEGEEETDRHWEKDTGSQKEQRGKILRLAKSKEGWVRIRKIFSRAVKKWFRIAILHRIQS